MIKLDFNNDANNDDANTQAGFTPFTLANNGSEVNGVAIDLGWSIQPVHRNTPYGTWNKGVYYPRAGERIYRDFVHGISPSGVTITLWGLGVNRDCNITIWAFDDLSIGHNRIANWYANGTHILDTNFIGGTTNWPRYELTNPEDLYKWAFSGTATTDEFGRIVLTSSKDPCSPEGQTFAFVNALVVEPNNPSQPFVPPVYAQHPVPFDGNESVPADAVLAWKQGGYAEKHDVYLGTDFNDVNDANRTIPLGVLVSQDHTTATYNPPELLDLNTTYYWRIDEVNSAPDYTIFKGEVWSFKTLPYFNMENFNSYADNAALRNVWENGGTSAAVSVETGIVRDGNSMKYRYNNNLSPYYSEAYMDIADSSRNWLGISAQTLVLRLYGEPTNPTGEQMYVKLTDNDGTPHTATVTYDNLNGVRLKQWNKLSVALTEFAGVNLTNVARITIGFGNGSPGEAGTVYFEDITLEGAGFEEPVPTGEVDAGTTYQELEGFGAAIGFWETFLPWELSEPDRNSLFDILFDESGFDIHRIRNTYGYDSDYIVDSANIIAAGKARNPSLKIMISAWTPQPSLKDNNDIIGGDNATLAKDANDPNNSAPYYYVYKKYAKWWADSLTDWSNHGVDVDYLSIQNEPDYDATNYDSCRFDPNETPTIAGYNLAFEAVYQELYSRMGPNIPKMLAPEVLGIYNPGTYINNLVDANHVYGYAHHLYAGGGDVGNPDGFIPLMTNLRNNFSDRPLMQTEFSKLGSIEGGDVTTFPDAMSLALLLHDSLVFENASTYIYWELISWTPVGLVSFTWQSGYTYFVNPLYYAFKQYAAFTDPGWHRVEASTDLGDLGDLRISAFKSPDNQQLSIMIINLADDSINLSLNLNGFLQSNSEIYRTSATENAIYVGPFYGKVGLLELPAQSITTIHSNNTVPSNCDEVQDAGFGLTSDTDGDCYVNYEDLKIITDHWLDTDCTGPEHCEGADFAPTDGAVNLLDLSRFAEQWLWCNDPEDSNCVNNW
jgi:O-glycosyl hydrolase